MEFDSNISLVSNNKPLRPRVNVYPQSVGTTWLQVCLPDHGFWYGSGGPRPVARDAAAIIRALANHPDLDPADRDAVRDEVRDLVGEVLGNRDVSEDEVSALVDAERAAETRA